MPKRVKPQDPAPVVVDVTQLVNNALGLADAWDASNQVFDVAVMRGVGEVIKEAKKIRPYVQKENTDARPE